MVSVAREQDVIFDALSRQLEKCMAMSYDLRPLGTDLRLQFTSLTYYRRRRFQCRATYGDLADRGTESHSAGAVVEVRFGNEEFSIPLWNSSPSMPLGSRPESIEAPLFHLYDRTMKDGMEKFLGSLGQNIKYVNTGDIAQAWASQPPVVQVEPQPELGLYPAEIAEAALYASQYLFERRRDLMQPFVNFFAGTTERYLVNSEGTRLYTGEVRGSVNMSASVRTREGYYDVCGEALFSRLPRELLDKGRLEGLADRMLERASVLETAELEPSGPAAVILGPRAFGTFMHEAVAAHLLSAEYIDKKVTSVFAQSLGQAICPSFLTVRDDPLAAIDDPTDPRGWGSYRYDYEGTPVRGATVLIENGVLRSFLHTRATAALRGLPPTGHSRGNYSPTHNQSGHQIRAAYEPRISNMIVEVVDPSYMVTEEKLVERALALRGDRDYVLWVEGSGGSVDPRKGLFVLQPEEMWRLYPDGRRQAVRGAELSGEPHIMLGSIEVCGGRTETHAAVCGAPSGYVPVSTTAPAALIRRMTVNQTPQVKHTLPLVELESQGR